jgi:hypothetical protein
MPTVDRVILFSCTCACVTYELVPRNTSTTTSTEPHVTLSPLLVLDISTFTTGWHRFTARSPSTRTRFVFARVCACECFESIVFV